MGMERECVPETWRGEGQPDGNGSVKRKGMCLEMRGLEGEQCVVGQGTGMGKTP